MKLLKFLTSDFNRVAKRDVGSIIKAGERFALEDGFYHNEDESIVFKSTDKTGCLFTKDHEKKND